jgi:transcriptional regulator with PAS, ATPase and Fis domain
VSELPLNLQVKFLRVLQEREFTPVGTTSPISVSIRFIASTNRDLKQEIKNGRFREDLFYRLNVIEINLPSLKEREDDIPVLADHFLNKYRKEMNKNIKGIDNDAIKALIGYEWKGEVRELENVIERAVIFAKEDFITLKDLPIVFRPDDILVNHFTSGSLDDSVKNFERDYIVRTLENNDFDKEKTADVLKVGLSTLYRKMKELDIKA